MKGRGGGGARWANPFTDCMCESSPHDTNFFLFFFTAECIKHSIDWVNRRKWLRSEFHWLSAAIHSQEDGKYDAVRHKRDSAMPLVDRKRILLTHVTLQRNGVMVCPGFGWWLSLLFSWHAGRPSVTQHYRHSVFFCCCCFFSCESNTKLHLIYYGRTRPLQGKPRLQICPYNEE